MLIIFFYEIVKTRELKICVVNRAPLVHRVIFRWKSTFYLFFPFSLNAFDGNRFNVTLTWTLQDCKWQTNLEMDNMLKTKEKKIEFRLTWYAKFHLKFLQRLKIIHELKDGEEFFCFVLFRFVFFSLAINCCSCFFFFYINPPAAPLLHFPSIQLDFYVLGFVHVIIL